MKSYYHHSLKHFLLNGILKFKHLTILKTGPDQLIQPVRPGTDLVSTLVIVKNWLSLELVRIGQELV